MLLCIVVGNVTTVRSLNHSLQFSVGSSDSLPENFVILQTTGSGCDMRAVDFDEDGDLDLVMGESKKDKWRPRFHRYFDRISNDVLEELTGEQNPLDVFGGRVQEIADLDGDARMDVIVTDHEDDEPFKPLWTKSFGWRYFRRTAAGTFLEPQENPLGEIQFTRTSWNNFEVHVADWNSDGLPDVFFLEVDTNFGKWNLRAYQHVVDLDLRRNVHFDAYNQIRPGIPGIEFSFATVNWSLDEFEDVVIMQYNKDKGHLELLLYEFQFNAMKEVAGIFDNVTQSLKGSHVGRNSVVLIDWDVDGDLDLLLSSAFDGKLHYHEMVSGSFQEEASSHPFKNVQLYTDASDMNSYVSKPMVVDWDADAWIFECALFFFCLPTV